MRRHRQSEDGANESNDIREKYYFQKELNDTLSSYQNYTVTHRNVKFLP